jgi:competence ComEA-like helix-hairpin-helix protein
MRTDQTVCTSLFPAFFLLCLLLLTPSQPVFAQTNINSATKKQLMALPYIGEVKAEAIISHRLKNGPFKSINNIQNVRGIGEKSFLILEPLITVSGTSKPQKPKAQTDDPIAQSIRTGQIMILTNQQYLPMLRNFIRTAKHRIDIGMYIFKVGKSENNGPRQVLKELIAARKRGVKITIILENSSYSESLNEDNRRVARMLRKHKINVKFDSKKRTTHTKIVIIDGRFAFVGSHNFTHSALTKNNEITLLLDNPRVTRDISKYLNNIH